jgi:hypothetical protein
MARSCAIYDKAGRDAGFGKQQRAAVVAANSSLNGLIAISQELEPIFDRSFNQEGVGARGYSNDSDDQDN